jgi:Rieske Fe-S protein
MNDKEVGRRTFLNWLLGGTALASLVAVLYPAARFLEPQEVPEAAISNLKIGVVSDFPPDSGTIFKFGRKPGILIHTANGKFKAFSATCTHLGCIVQYRKDLGLIYCACHGGRFDLNGKNIAGPPPRPLQEFDVHLKGDEIYVSVRS